MNTPDSTWLNHSRFSLWPRVNRFLSRAFAYLVVIAACIFTLAPFWFMLKSSLTETNQIFTKEFRLWPERIYWQNYQDIFTDRFFNPPIWHYIGNSAFVAVMQVTGM